MAVVKDSLGGWTWYVDQIKANIKVLPETIDYKDLMKKYISGTPWEKIVEEMNK